MRWDMKEVIIETARAGGDRKDKDRRPQPLRDSEGFPDLPSHEKMRYRREKNQGDKLSPLRAFLESKVGQQWDDVFSEICEVNDKRSMLGFHLLTHLQQYVHARGLKNEHRYVSPDFFQDSDGTLQKAKKRYRWDSQAIELALQTLKEPMPAFQLEDGWRYQKEKNNWYRMKEVVISDTYVSEYIDEEKYEIVRVIKPTSHVKTLKFQCNKKEMQKVRNLIAQEVVKRQRIYTKTLARYR